MTAALYQATLKGRAILLIEDEFFQAEDLARALSEASAQPVGPFPSMETAAGALSGRGVPVDAAILDINLRGRMAWPIAEMLAQQGIPFLFATGYDKGFLLEAYRSVQVLEKPFRIEGLLSAVAGLCAQKPSRG